MKRNEVNKFDIYRSLWYSRTIKTICRSKGNRSTGGLYGTDKEMACNTWTGDRKD